MTLDLLCLGFTLLGILQAQAQDPPPALPMKPSLYKVPLKPNFQDDQFQGKWYTIAVADNVMRFENVTQINMYSTIFQLKDDHSYDVSSIMFSGEDCQHSFRTFVPTVLPGQFTLENMTSFDGVQSYMVRMVATDYDRFAVIFLETIYKSRIYIEIILLGRTKQLSPRLKKSFFKFSKSFGLTKKDIIFTDPIEQCIDFL
ncbi:neutrophil gelatinase-associated lipocalin-like [Cavia porcellus]|uniref:neutrophil gelatinase-associated lipocalin-like n=1 Tax=Cavia porcellus TaxID=10141 RepID=UPI002FE41265